MDTQGAWMAQSVKPLTLDLGSGDYLTGVTSNPTVSLPTRDGACLRFSFSLYLCPSPTQSLCSRSLKVKQTLKKYIKIINF